MNYNQLMLQQKQSKDAPMVNERTNDEGNISVPERWLHRRIYGEQHGAKNYFHHAGAQPCRVHAPAWQIQKQAAETARNFMVQIGKSTAWNFMQCLSL